MPAGDKERLFIALPVSPALKEQLCALPHKGLEARWTHPDDLHITLRFLGDIPAGQADEIRNLLPRIRRPSFNIEVAGMDYFQTGRQVILWAAVRSTRKLTALAADINEIMAPLGFEMPNKPYVPHVTIARMKRPAGLERYIGQHGAHIKDSWTAEEFALYRSAAPDEKGSRYSKLKTYFLQ